jgi:hypothetical protein
MAILNVEIFLTHKYQISKQFFIFFFFHFSFIIHMCIQGLVHFSPLLNNSLNVILVPGLGSKHIILFLDLSFSITVEAACMS